MPIGHCFPALCQFHRHISLCRTSHCDRCGKFQHILFSTILITFIFLPKKEQLSLCAPTPHCTPIFIVSKARVAQASTNLLQSTDVQLAIRRRDSRPGAKSSSHWTVAEQTAASDGYPPQATCLWVETTFCLICLCEKKASEASTLKHFPNKSLTRECQPDLSTSASSSQFDFFLFFLLDCTVTPDIPQTHPAPCPYRREQRPGRKAPQGPPVPGPYPQAGILSPHSGRCIPSERHSRGSERSQRTGPDKTYMGVRPKAIPPNLVGHKFGVA